MEKGNDMEKLWKYREEDLKRGKPSWKYLNHIVIHNDKDTQILWVKNPHFAYENLSPYDPNDISVDEYKILKMQIDMKKLEVDNAA